MQMSYKSLSMNYTIMIWKIQENQNMHSYN